MTWSLVNANARSGKKPCVLFDKRPDHSRHGAVVMIPGVQGKIKNSFFCIPRGKARNIAGKQRKNKAGSENRSAL